MGAGPHLLGINYPILDRLIYGLAVRPSTVP
jgi:hypothetical protein